MRHLLVAAVMIVAALVAVEVIVIALEKHGQRPASNEEYVPPPIRRPGAPGSMERAPPGQERVRLPAPGSTSSGPSPAPRPLPAPPRTVDDYRSSRG